MGNTGGNTHGLTVESIMEKNVIAASQDMTIRDTIKLLLDKKISGAPVVDEHNKIVSIISQIDLFKLGAKGDFDCTIKEKLKYLVPENKIIFVKAGDSFTEVFKKLLANPVRRVVVLDYTNKLRGIVSRSSILKVLLENASAS